MPEVPNMESGALSMLIVILTELRWNSSNENLELLAEAWCAYNHSIITLLARIAMSEHKYIGLSELRTHALTQWYFNDIDKQGCAARAWTTWWCIMNSCGSYEWMKSSKQNLPEGWQNINRPSLSSQNMSNGSLKVMRLLMRWRLADI